jgi:hypothetical protein
MLSAAATALLVAWIVAYGGRRLADLARGADARDGVGETRFWSWAYRDPPLVGRLEEAARPLSTGEAVVPVCVPECETGWFGTMAIYALPRQAVVGAKTVGQLGTVFPTRIVRTRTEVRVEPRSGTDARR